jgi:formylglycine-generating enzyme required for sulfatase activity
MLGGFLFLLISLGMAQTAHSSNPSPAPGEVFQDCPECPEMVVVPPGLFIMGLGGTTPAEGPRHRVFIRQAFAIGRHEITFDNWRSCFIDGACGKTPDDHEWGRGIRPVINLTYPQIENYLSWLSNKTGQVYRLPSEAEWEYAHRGGTTTTFYWGDEVGVNLANCKDCKSPWSAKSTAPVGSFEPNAFGLYDTAGNAYEWTADCWNANHKGAPGDGSARTDGDCKQRVMRGGSFYYFSKVARSSYRSKNQMQVNSYWLSFRVVRELP